MIRWIKEKIIAWLIEDITRKLDSELFPERYEILRVSYLANKSLRQVLDHLHPSGTVNIILNEHEIPRSIIASEICQTCGLRYFKTKDDK